MPAHGWKGQYQVDFCTVERACAKLNVCHLFIHYHENQVIFHGKCFVQALNLRKRQTASWKWSEVAHIPVSVAWSDLEYFYYSLDRMLVHPRIIPILNLPVPIYTPEWREALWESCPKTQHAQPGLEPRLLDIEKKYKNEITCLHTLLINSKMNN